MRTRRFQYPWRRIGILMVLWVAVQGLEGSWLTPLIAQKPALNRSTDEIASPTVDNYSEMSPAELQRLIAEAKQSKPNSSLQYLEMQRTIRDASQALLKRFKDKTSPTFENVEFDYVSSSVMLLGNEGEEAPRKTFEKFRDYLKEKEKLTINDIKIALLAGQNLEHLDDHTIARDAYLEFASIIEGKKDETFADMVGLFKASHRRLDLPGKVIELKGTLSDGKSFDISSSRGKYLLIHVFATWSQPCVQEFSHLQKLYEGFREKGFEVIGISLDEKQGDLVDFVKKQDVTWPILWDASTPRSHPFAQEHGIVSLPTSILLDREGKVVALEANAPALAVALDRIFNAPTPVPSANQNEAPEGNSAEKKSAPKKD